MKTVNYTPYGDKWKKEMERLPKKIIINMFADVKLKLHNLEAKPTPPICPHCKSTKTFSICNNCNCSWAVI